MLDLHDVYLPGLQNGGHLDIGKSGIRNPESGFCFFLLESVCIGYRLYSIHFYR